ncbi:MAG: hypothetical protein KAH57_09935 [Thermoplasmata archaeon]|nr:hypothetical protein [Thermoplasmata archaeon]
MRGRIFSLGILLVCLMFAVPAIPLLPFSGEVEVAEGAVAPSTDEAGYIWFDSKDPGPKIDYDFEDISQTGTKMTFTNGNLVSNRAAVRYYAWNSVDLPFTFSYYGVDYDSIDVATAGKIGLGAASSNRYFYYWSYYYDIPNAYMPGNTIFVYSSTGMAIPEGTVAAPGGAYAGAGIYTQPGVDENGVQYMTVQWNRACSYYFYVYYYGYSNYDITFQARIYEDGRIECHYKDTTSPQYSNGGYTVVGISNTENTGALQYYKGAYGDRGIPDNLAVMFKQYKTDLDYEISEGYGEDGDIYPAFGGPEAWDEGGTRNLDDYNDHWARINVWSERGIEYLNTVDLYIKSETNPEGVRLSYNVGSGTFAKTGDPTRNVYFNPSFSRFEVDVDDPEHNVTVLFHYDFLFTWSDYDPVDLTFATTGIGVLGSSKTTEAAYTVESRMAMVGNLSIINGNGQTLESGDWVLGGDTLYFSGLNVEYFGLGDTVITPPAIRVYVLDQTTVKHFGPAAALDTYIYIDPGFVNLIFRLKIDGIPDDQDRSDRTLKKDFTFRVDSDMPGTPGEIIVYPDSLDEEPRDYDNDRKVFITWTDAVDLSSGVAFYHISLNEPHATANMEDVITVEKGIYYRAIESIPEGTNKIYLWAEDSVGNHGPEVFSTIRIDLTTVYFDAFYPSSDVWITDIRPTCSILVNDTITGVDPLSIEYETSTGGVANLIGEWEQVQESYAPGTSLRVVVVGWFRNGKDNYIRFRAKDLAGNDYGYSEPHNIWIDSDQPRYRLKSPADEDDFQINPVQSIQIQIDDTESGVDGESIEYRFTTSGTDKFTPWKPYKDAESGNTVLVNLRLTLRRGDNNYIQVRAKDLAGNPLKSSPEYNIKVNTYPVIEITSPTGGEILYSNEPITFDATDSFDLDGDSISYKWYKSGPTGMIQFGITSLMTANFVAGEHTIKLVVTDSVENDASFSFTILVEEPRSGPYIKEGDADLDNIPDWWEIKFHLDPLEKDSDNDVDGDEFSNLQEYMNETDPLNPFSHPPIPPKEVDQENIGPFGPGMWPIWLILVALILAIVITLSVIQRKKNSAEKRIKTVRNMRKIMPSVSWEQITTTAALAPFVQAGLGVPQDMSTALPAAQAVDLSTALPPAQEAAVASEAVPEPTPNPAPVPASVPEAAPAPVAAPVGSVPAPAPMPGADMSNLPAPEQPPQQ